jgi:ABC-type transport system involved in multi-copper enzyme maturation permease subunit
VAFALVATLAFAFGMFLPGIQPRERGQILLISLTVCAFVLNLFSGAGLTADAITSEKRQGTLGLLFLTPLRGWQIVIGKLAMQSLQVGYAMFSSIPLLFVPILLGGIVWVEVARIIVALVLTLFFSLAVGLFWSTMVREARTAILATTVSLLLISLLPWLACLLELAMVTRRAPVFMAPALVFSPATSIVFGFEENFRARVGSATGLLSGPSLYWASTAGLVAGGWLLTLVSGRALPFVWQQAELALPPAAKEPSACTDHSWRRTLVRQARQRDHAPLLWLAARDLREALWLRLLRWTTLAFFGVMLLVSVSTRHWEEGYITAFCTAYGLHLVTRIQFALSATRRWQEDRRSGGLELVLTTPISDSDLVRAHHVAAKHAFRWPLLALLGMNVALLLAMILWFEHLHMKGGAWAIFSVFFVGGALVTLTDFAALRWLSLCEGLRRATHTKAVGGVLSRLYLGPWLAFGVTLLVAVQFRHEEAAAVVFASWFLLCLANNLGLILSCRRWLRRGLRLRAAEG